MFKAIMRTFAGPYLFPVYLITGLAVSLLNSRWDFLGDSYLTLETLPNVLLYTLPLTGAIAAHDTAKLFVPGTKAMLIPTRHRHIAVTFPALLAGSAAGAAHILVTAVLLALGQVTNPAVGWHRVGLTLLVQVSVLYSGAFLGGVAGRYLATRTAAFSTFIGLFILGISSEFTPIGTPWIQSMGATAPQLGYVWGLHNQLIRGITMALLITLAAIVITKGLSTGQSRRIHSGIAAAALIAVGFGGFFLPKAPFKVPLSDSLPRNTCMQHQLITGDVLTTCVHNEHKRLNAYAGQSYAQAYNTLLAAGVSIDYLPLHLDELLRAPSPHHGKPGYSYMMLPAQSLVVPAANLPFDEEMQQAVPNGIAMFPTCDSDVLTALQESNDQEFYDAWDKIFGFMWDIFPDASLQFAPGETSGFDAQDFMAANDKVAQLCATN